MSRSLRAATAVLVAAGVVATTPPAASAHSVLVSSDPAAGSTTRGVIHQASLTFDENVRAPAFVVVTGPDGRRVDHSRASILNATVTEQLASGLTDGRYTLAYRVVSADGHPVENRFTFTVTGTGRRARAAAATALTAADRGSNGWYYGGAGLVVVTGAVALLLGRRRRDTPNDGGAG